MSAPSINCCVEHKETSRNRQTPRKINKKRPRLNELDHRLSCSIVGTCITLAELTKIRQKAKLFLHENIDDYDLHRIFVNTAGEKSYANKLMQKLLDQKYKPMIAEFSKAHTQDALQKLWKQAVKKGEVAAAFWALITHPDSEKKLIDKIYGEIHMLSHLSGASVRVDMQELTLLRQENKKLKEQQAETLSSSKKRLYEKEALIRKQTKLLDKLQLEVNALKVAASAPSSLTKNSGVSSSIVVELNKLKTKLHFANNKLIRMEMKSAITFTNNTELEKSLDALQTELEQVTEDNSNLENLLDKYLTPCVDKQCQTTTKYCDHSDLDGKCILYVGGRDRQCSHFRALVESNNGHFIHHDGGKSDGISKLYSTLTKADAVMCPLDCISHEAMINVKRHCKNAAKPLVMMPRSSYSAFSKGLSQIVQ